MSTQKEIYTPETSFTLVPVNDSSFTCAKINKSYLENTTESQNNLPSIHLFSSPEDIIDDKFGRYKILSILGQGGMGHVYKAFDTQLHRQVALKIVNGNVLFQKDIDRFLREAKANARLKHPGIVTLFDIGEHRGLPFFTMDLIEGCSLKELMEKKYLTFSEISHIIRKIGIAIHYAHEQGVIHRDLKPANIMMENGREPKIADFGLAKLVSEEEKLTKPGMILGTLRYMSPEQASLKPEKIDIRTDIYSLGVIFYEMLTGESVVQPTNPKDMINQVLYNQTIPPSILNSEIPKTIDRICMKAIAKNKDERYQHADDFVRDLKNFMLGKIFIGTVPNTKKISPSHAQKIETEETFKARENAPLKIAAHSKQPMQQAQSRVLMSEHPSALTIEIAKKESGLYRHIVTAISTIAIIALALTIVFLWSEKLIANKLWEKRWQEEQWKTAAQLYQHKNYHGAIAIYKNLLQQKSNGTHVIEAMAESIEEWYRQTEKNKDQKGQREILKEIENLKNNRYLTNQAVYKLTTIYAKIHNNLQAKKIKSKTKDSQAKSKVDKQTKTNHKTKKPSLTIKTHSSVVKKGKKLSKKTIAAKKTKPKTRPRKKRTKQSKRSTVKKSPIKKLPVKKTKKQPFSYGILQFTGVYGGRTATAIVHELKSNAMFAVVDHSYAINKYDVVNTSIIGRILGVEYAVFGKSVYSKKRKIFTAYIKVVDVKNNQLFYSKTVAAQTNSEIANTFHQGLRKFIKERTNPNRIAKLKQKRAKEKRAEKLRRNKNRELRKRREVEKKRKAEEKRKKFRERLRRLEELRKMEEKDDEER